jgi:hypothetical protein
LRQARPRKHTISPFRVERCLQSNDSCAERGDAVRLRFTSDAPGEIHFHAYRLSAALAPGTPAELKFTAHATGRFRIEWHPTAGTDKKSDHHGAPLAILEVRPK